MVTLTLSADFKGVQRKLDALQKDVREKALVRAVNRTTEQARTDMSREIRSVFNISAAKVREKLYVRYARFNSGQLFISAALISFSKEGRGLEGFRTINLINFSAKLVKRGVSVKIKKQGPRKTRLGAFIGNTGRTVFERVPGTMMVTRNLSRGKKHREKIKPVGTIDVPQMFNTKRINAAVIRNLRAKFPTIVDREIAFYARKFNATR